MPAIGIIDDRVDARETLAMSLNNSLPESWEVIEADPLRSLDDYPSWLSENEIAALVLDERLNEVVVEGEHAVTYFGHDLVEYLRVRMAELPIFVVTSNSEDAELVARFGKVEDIIDRLVFLRNPDNYTPRFLRASQRYLEAFSKELADLSSIAVKVAGGEALSNEEQVRAQAIQQKIDTAFSIDDIQTRNQWIVKIEETVQGLDKLRDEVASIIKRSEDREVDKDS